MTAPSLPGPRSGLLARLPGGVLVVMAAAFTGAYLGDRALPTESTVLAALLLPLAWLLIQPTVCVCDGLVERWFLLALLLLVWMAGVQGLRPDALPVGWIRFAERGAALAGCLAVAVGRVPVREMIALMGRSAAVVALLALLVDGPAGRLAPLSIISFGFGQLNLLTDTAGPSLLAWAVLTIGDACQRRRTGMLDLALLALGAGALAAIAILTQRRGVTLALALAGLLPALRWLWGRHRRIAQAVVALGLLAGAVLLVRLFGSQLPSLRNERIADYRVAIEGVAAGLPFGFGHFGMLHTQGLPGEACRHFAACGTWFQHAHNEFLDVALDGGPLALLLAGALTALVAWRVTRIRDPQVRLALEMAGIAIGVHLMTDNVFGLAPGELWLGSALGMMLGAPVAGAMPAPLRLLPRVRLLAWLFTLPALAGALVTFYPAIVQNGASPEIRWRCLKQSCDPLIIDIELSSLVYGAEALDNDNACAALDQAVRKVGWNGQYAAFAAHLADAGGRPGELAAALVRVLGFSPFYRDAYQDLAQLIQRHPECAPAVPAAVQRRLAYLAGEARLPAPDLGAPLAGVEDAADAYAGISWAIATGRPWPPISGALHRLCRTYGDIPGVTQLVLQAVIAAPPGSFPWLGEQLPTIEVGVRFGFAPLALLAQVATRAQAQALLPVLADLYPAARSAEFAAAAPALAKALVRVEDLAAAPPMP
jgi:hypothetical protein